MPFDGNWNENKEIVQGMRDILMDGWVQHYLRVEPGSGIQPGHCVMGAFNLVHHGTPFYEGRQNCNNHPVVRAMGDEARQRGFVAPEFLDMNGFSNVGAAVNYNNAAGRTAHEIFDFLKAVENRL